MTDPRTTMTVDVDVPEEIVAEAREQMEAAQNPGDLDLDEFILDRLELELNY